MISPLPIVLVLGVCLLAETPRGMTAPVFPFGEFHLQVDTNAGEERRGGRDRVSMTLDMRKRMNPVEDRVSIDIRCRRFPVESQEFGKQDIEAFLGTAEAGLTEENSPLTTETVSAGGEKKTVFQSEKRGSKWVLEMRRSGKSAVFELEKAERLRSAIRQAMVGRNWYQQLLDAEVVPVPAENAKPPEAADYAIAVPIGNVRAGDLEFKLETRNFHIFGYGNDSAPLDVRSSIASSHGIHHSRWSLHKFATRLSRALDAVHKGRTYSVVSKEAWRYRVSSNLETGKVDAYFPFGIGQDSEEIVAVFDQNKLNELQKLIETGTEYANWLHENETLLITRIPGKESIFER